MVQNNDDEGDAGSSPAASDKNFSRGRGRGEEKISAGQLAEDRRFPAARESAKFVREGV